MTDATTADRIPLELLVDEAIREAQQGLQHSGEEELGELAESITPDDLESRTTSPVVRRAAHDAASCTEMSLGANASSCGCVSGLMH